MGKKPNQLDAFLKENVDLENIVIEKVFENLRCNREGLTSAAAKERLVIFGRNENEEKRSKILIFLGYMWNPLAWIMEAAAIMALTLANGGGKPADWPVFVGIIALLICNSISTFAWEIKADYVAWFAPRPRVLRNGGWIREINSVLVPGDIISVKKGVVVPADARLLDGDLVKIDESTLTGKSLLVTKGPGDCVYSGSICTQGEIEAVIIATGVCTRFREASHIVDSSNQVRCFQKGVNAIENFFICFVAVVMIIETIVMYCIQHREYRPWIDNLLVLLIGGIPIGMPATLSIITKKGAFDLAKEGATTKRMTAVLDMAAMDVLCCEKTGILTQDRLYVLENFIEVFAEDIDKATVVLMAARASSPTNHGTIDSPFFENLADPRKARAGLREIDFLPYNPTGRRTTLTYLDGEGEMHRVSMGAAEHILNLAHNKSDIEHRVHDVIDKFAEKGLMSVAVAYQKVPDGKKESAGGPWQLIGLLPLVDHTYCPQSTITSLLNGGVNVKIITEDQLVFAKETGRRLRIGTNVYPSSVLLGQTQDKSIGDIPIDELIEKADGFSSVLPEHKYDIVKHLQSRKHICGMTGQGVNDVSALKKADIGMAISDATDAAFSAADVHMRGPGLEIIHRTILTSRQISERMKNYTMYVVSFTIRNLLSFTLLALIWKFDFPPLMILVIVMLNDRFILGVAKDSVKSSPQPFIWNQSEIFTTGIVLGVYLVMSTVIFFWATHETNIFPRLFGVLAFEKTTSVGLKKFASAIFLQVSNSNYALIFVTRTRSWLPGSFLVTTWVIAQFYTNIFAVYTTSTFPGMVGIGWGWAGVIWLYNLVFYIPLYFIKFLNQHNQKGFLKGTI